MRISSNIIMIVILIFLGSCGSSEQKTDTPSENELSEPDVPEGYPIPEMLVVSSESGSYPSPSSPAVLEVGYPLEDTVNVNTRLLALDRPVRVTDTTLTGVGPAGLTIFIMDITFMGNELGRTVIEEDGTFSVNVSELQPGIRLGLSADLASIGLTDADVLPGEGEISTPRVGYFYDSVVLEP